MRIGLDLRMAGEDYGIGRYGFELAKRVIASDRGNDYILFVRDPEKFVRAGFGSYKNVALVRADYRHYSFDEQLKFPGLLRAQNLDLVHFMNFNVPLLFNGAFVVTIHDVVHHKLPGNKPRRWLHRLAYRMVISHAARASKKIITVSNASRREIAAVLQVPAEKIEVIYEASAAVAVNESDRVAALQKFNISKPYLIFVGVMERKKNLLTLAKAFDLLKEKYNQNIQLVLAGKIDPYYPEIAGQLKSIKYSKDLIMTGVVSDREKFALYKGAQGFISASLFEGFGLPGVEAMSMGIPLLVSNTDVFNEVYDNGAMYFDPRSPEDIAQKANLLLNDDKYKELISRNAFERAARFSWEAAAHETLRVYEEALR